MERDLQSTDRSLRQIFCHKVAPFRKEEGTEGGCTSATDLALGGRQNVIITPRRDEDAETPSALSRQLPAERTSSSRTSASSSRREGG